jgi:hypothetical protein
MPARRCGASTRSPLDLLGAKTKGQEGCPWGGGDVSAGGGCLDPGQVDPEVDPEIHLEASQGSSLSFCSGNEKCHQAVASGSGGFPKFEAVAIEVPGLRHQHRLRAQKEPAISMPCRFQRIFLIPFACRFEALNHSLLPPLVVSSIAGLLVPDQRRELYMLCSVLSIAQNVVFDFFSPAQPIAPRGAPTPSFSDLPSPAMPMGRR